MRWGNGEETPTAGATKSGEVPKELTAQEIVEKLKTSVVQVNTTSPEGAGGGSGIVWEDARHILTNAHVVVGEASIKVVDPTEKRDLPAKIVALSQCDDIALLEVERGAFVPAALGDSKKLEPGEEVVALGYPGTATDWRGAKLSVTRGIVSKLGERYNGLEDLIQTDAAINPGNSGGPLVNKRGQVIGINTLGETTRQNINYAIAINEAKFIADKLTAGKNLNYIGAKLIQNYRGLAQELGIKLAYIDGIMVAGVDQGSPAFKAGLG